jgi:hypothetical protein|tara:strand:- start:248 stop:880 length:633 start_codon:yes stop_codon:yes gene_type:complete
MKIGYFITACNEYEELKKLLILLRTNIDKNDCIGVLLDEKNVTDEVDSLCNQFLVPDNESFRVIYSNLDNDFASFKNLGYHLFDDCDWIFNIDADELPSSILIQNIKQIINLNPETELIYIPRINTVEGLTQDHVNKWKWQVNEEGWVNWPDYQGRIYKRSPIIEWKGKVHERIEGMKKYSHLPAKEEFAFHHPKTIERQEKQNKFYETL